MVSTTSSLAQGGSHKSQRMPMRWHVFARDFLLAVNL
jgi:hypothetical protein